jgi:hypothetical protein
VSRRRRHDREQRRGQHNGPKVDVSHVLSVVFLIVKKTSSSDGVCPAPQESVWNGGIAKRASQLRFFTERGDAEAARRLRGERRDYGAHCAARVTLMNAVGGAQAPAM